MKIKFIRALPLVFAVIAILHLGALPSNAQKAKGSKAKSATGKPKVEILKAQKGETGSKSGNAEDPNIKEKETLNNPDAERTAPEKSAAKTCKLMLDNWTNFTMEVYINGVYKGTLSGGNESTLYLPAPQQVTVYVRAPFSDGTYYYWGPKTYQCGPNQYIWAFKLDEY